MRPSALLALPLALGSACSLLVDTNATQCRSDSDCTRFAAICQLEQHVCVPAADVDAAVPSLDTGCVGPGGCFSCTPTTEAEFTAQCTDSECIPFDDSRLTLWTADGHLRPLP